MKVLATVGVAALMTMGLAAQASAFSLNPKPTTSLTITGPTTLSAFGTTINCTSTFGGSINASGVGSISSASFSGSGCGIVSPSGLPWTVTAIDATHADITNVKVVVAGLVTCGPGTVHGTLVGTQPTKTLSFTGTIGSCSVASNPTVTSSVALSITNP